MSIRADTIVAIATAPGRGGIGVVRVSGPLASEVSESVVGRLLPHGKATLCRFLGDGHRVLDEGIVLYFCAPHSYTGEDVLELQGHGGPVVLREIVRRCVALGARLAEPGEFTRRAFLNGRLDLAQAEAVADLIDAASVEAARGAARSLTGEFSRRVQTIARDLVDLRMQVEACIDFPEEEIESPDHHWQWDRLAAIRASLDAVLVEAGQGAILREGLTVVLAGRPNVGKSSLLNRLAGEEVAIVTPIPGTTRDFVRASILLEGVPIHLIDTAGLRDASDEVERLGIARAWEAISKAGAVILLSDNPVEIGNDKQDLMAKMPAGVPVAKVLNKVDLLGLSAGVAVNGQEAAIRLSAKTGAGVDALKAWLLEVAGWRPNGEDTFLARDRHLSALRAARRDLEAASENVPAGELFAEDLRKSQQHLGRITGEVTADDLLGEIFSRFCIGK